MKDFQSISVINAKKSTKDRRQLITKILMKIWAKESLWQKRVNIDVRHAIILSLNIENLIQRRFRHPRQRISELTATSNDNAANIAVGHDEDQIRLQSPENADAQSSSKQVTSRESVDTNTASISPSEKVVSPKSKGDAIFHPIHSLIGMPAYDSEAILIGKVQEIGLRRPTTSSGNTQISIKIIRDDSNKNDTSDNLDSNNVTTASTIEILWNEISKIGDIVLLSRGPANSRTENAVDSTSTRIHGSEKCSSCGYQNEKDAIFCEECGKKLENK